MIGIINFNTGHINNLAAALKKAGGEIALLDNPGADDIDKLVIYSSLRISEIIEFLKNSKFDEYIIQLCNSNVPILAINSGLHCLFEDIQAEKTDGLGLIPGSIKPLENTVYGLNFYTGWLKIKLNTEFLIQNKNFVLFDGIDIAKSPLFYFNHRYFIDTNAPDITVASADYELNSISNNSDRRKAEFMLPVALKYRNIFGLQFLPEKSNHIGIKVLRNFVGYKQNTTKNNKSEE